MEALVQWNSSGDIRNDIPGQIGKALECFLPTLEARRAEIESVPRQTIRYGDTDRLQMDIYYPESTESGTAPVLLFVYGGGYATGAKVQEPPADVVYRNVGAYFSKKGFVTVIPDYTILPNTKWPQAPTEILAALTYLIASPPKSPTSVTPDLSKVFLTGHSAGGAIASEALLHRTLASADVRARIRGLHVFAGMQHYTGVTFPLMPGALEAYYGTDAELHARCASALLGALPDELVGTLPDVAVTVSQFDIPAAETATRDWRAEVEKRTGKEVSEFAAKGHNHVSPHWALMTGDGEEWAEDLVKWIQARV